MLLFEEESNGGVVAVKIRTGRTVRGVLIQVVMFLGQRYKRYPNAGSPTARRYFVRSWRQRTVFLHRAVWEHYHGRIPKGYVIHHKDKDTGNNDISNLECMTVSKHSKLHQPESSKPGECSKAKARNLARIRHLGWKAHKTSKSRRKQSRKIKAWLASRPGVEFARCVDQFGLLSLSARPGAIIALPDVARLRALMTYPRNADIAERYSCIQSTLARIFVPGVVLIDIVLG